jgi:hypothetical protein
VPTPEIRTRCSGVSLLIRSSTPSPIPQAPRHAHGRRRPRSRLRAVGDLFCLNAADGKVVWKHNTVGGSGGSAPDVGMGGAPLVEGDQLITLAGGAKGPESSVSDKKTGPRALARDRRSGGSATVPPVIFRFGESRQLIGGHPRACVARSRDGHDPAGRFRSRSGRA